MQMKLSWITYKSKKILFVDYRGKNTQEMIEQLEYETKVILEQKEPVLYLADFTGCPVSNEFMEKANSLGKLTAHLQARSAILGISGMKSVLLNTFNLFTSTKLRAFNSEIEAKEYLVK
jgi:hypothetical protein